MRQSAQASCKSRWKMVNGKWKVGMRIPICHFTFAIFHHNLSSRNMANVLIVDDDVDGCKPLVKLLQYVGHSPFFVHDGRAALSMLDQLRPDMILLDVMMPGVDGLEVLKTIRAHPVHKDLPVVVYSALNDSA